MQLARETRPMGFQLDFHVKTGEDALCTSLKAIANQWDVITGLLSIRGPSVKMTVQEWVVE